MNKEKQIDCPYAEKGCSRELSECIKRHFLEDYPQIWSWLEIEEKMFSEEVDEMLERYYALCAQGYRKQAWISVEDALPEQGKNVLCFESGKLYVAFREDYEAEGIFWDFVEYDRYDSWCEVCPTHWMPLPEPPKGEEHE